MWVSIPSAGGSKRPAGARTKNGGPAQLRKHWRNFGRIWNQTMKLLEAARECGAKVAVE